MENVWTILVAFGLPSAVVSGIAGIFFRRIEKRMDKEKKEQEERMKKEKAEQEKREEARRKHEAFLVKTLTANIALSKANAIALKNGKCNGETSAALAYLNTVKHEHHDFLTEQGIDHLF